MKKQTKLVTAFILTLLLLVMAPVTAFAATTQTGSISGSSDVTDVVLNVILPTTLNFALDPLGLDATGQNQISTQDFFFVNQTLAPVKVGLTLSAQTSGGAVLVSTNSGIKKDDTSETSKKIYFGALGATGLTGEAITTTTTGISYSSIFTSTGPAAEYATVSAVAPTLVKFTPNANGTTGSAVVSFALDKADEDTTTPGTISALASGNAGVGAFQFFAEMNTYADWRANDLTVSGAYTLTALRDSTYDAFTFISGGLNQLQAAAGVTYSSPGFIISDGVTATTHASITHVSTSAVNIEIPFYFGSTTVTAFTSYVSSSFPVATTQYAIDTANNKFIWYATDAACMLRTAGVGTKQMTITLSNNSTYTFNLIQQ